MADRRVAVGNIAGNYVAFGVRDPEGEVISVPVSRGFVSAAGPDSQPVLGYVNALRKLGGAIRGAYPQDGLVFEPAGYGLTMPECREVRNLNIHSKNGPG